MDKKIPGTKAQCRVGALLQSFFGPGYYGMPLEAAGILCSLMDTEQVGISWHKERMEPMMSLAGIYLISEEPLIQNWNDCENCIGQSVGCEYCINKSGH